MFPVIVPPAGPATNPEMMRQFRIINEHLGTFTSGTSTSSVSTAFTVVTSSSSSTQTLPSAANATGRVYTVKNRGTGLVTVSPQGSETIDGKTAAHLYKNQCISVMSDGTNWVVLFILGAAYS
jgi:hypothetical protein